MRAPPPLVACTTRLDADIDLLAVAGATGVLFEQDGHGLAGRGEALRLDLDVGPDRMASIEAALARLQTDDEVGVPGSGAVAFAALPFRPGDPASIVVPALVVGRAADGTRWRTSIGPAGHEPLPLEAPSQPEGQPRSYVVRSCRAPEDWCGAVDDAVAALQAGEAAKVVLAREVEVVADAPLAVVEILGRLRAAYPSSMLFSINGFIGASPELLVSRLGDVVRSHPMAGTAARSADPVVDAGLAASLLSSGKDRAEHQVTIDMVLETVLPYCSYVDSEPEPAVVSLANVHHLASLLEGRLSTPAASILTLVEALHPTPAVCGWPATAALRLIDRLEGFGRGRYTGPVGWVDGRGNGRFAVAIRCAEVEGHRARLFAGNGIVADSVASTELAETRAKLSALLSALVRP